MTSLVRYEAARTALAEAHSVDEVKDIRDKAQAMAAYAKQANDTELVWLASEIKIRAERKCGELSAELPKAKTGPKVSPHDAEKSKAEVLSDAGISTQAASRYERLAAVPEDQFEQAVAAAKEVVGEVTTAHMLRVAAGVSPHDREKSDDHPTVKDALDEAQAEIDRLGAQVKALSVTDTATELKKQIEIRQGIESRLSDSMEKCRFLQRELDGYGKWYAELRKVTGLQSRTEITQAIRDSIGRRAA